MQNDNIKRLDNKQLKNKKKNSDKPKEKLSYASMGVLTYLALLAADHFLEVPNPVYLGITIVAMGLIVVGFFKKR